MAFLLGFATQIVSKVFKYAFDAFTEEEYENQRTIQRCYNQLLAGYNRGHQNIRYYYDDKDEQAKQEAKQKERKLREEYLKNLESANKKYIAAIISRLEQQAEVSEELLQNIKSIEDNVKEELEKQRESYIRFSSLNEILMTIQESKAKCCAYLKYLDNYKYKIEKSRDYLSSHLSANENYQDNLIPFSIKLPESYPYNGKLVYLYKSDLKYTTNKNGEHGYAYNVNDSGIFMNVYLPKSEKAFFESLEDDKKYPFLFYVVTTRAGKDVTYISCIRGKVKEAVNNGEGFDMEVQKHRKYDLKLQFPDNPYFTFTISKKDFVHADRSSPIGSTVHVYMKHCEFAMNETSEVTEFPEQSFSIKRFNDIPLRISDEEYNGLYNFLYMHNYLNVDPRWKIGPVMENDNLAGLILQAGNLYAIKVKFEEYRNGLILEYNGMVPRGNFLTYSDIFVLTDLQIQITQATQFENTIESNPDYLYDCSLFRTYLLMEFSHQFKMKTDTAMGIYLSQWDAVTKGLEDIKEYEKGFHAQIDPDTLQIIESRPGFDFLSCKEDSGEAVKYFHEFERTEGIKSRDWFGISKHDNSYYIYFKDSDFKNQFTARETKNGVIDIDFFRYGNVTSEKRQSDALRHFLSGNIPNDELRVELLDIKACPYKDNGDRIYSFYNKMIETNSTQKRIISKAYAARDFFIIQGPPGTGKTTVIKELIKQQLSNHSDSRILITSQANVAVDNVIKGLKELGTSTIVRCGDPDKISEETKDFSFDIQYNNYVESLNHVKGMSDRETALRKKWIRTLQNSRTNDFSHSVIMDGFNVVSATCTGMDNAKYCLQNTVFDLVIIDEAGKALPGELMIPITKAKKLILIGDHKQLPPTVDQKLTARNSDFDFTDIVTEEEREDFLNKSFFYRLYEDARDENKGMLDMQFRMPLQIAGLVNLFYDGQLKSGKNVREKTPLFGDSFLYVLDASDNPDYHEEKAGNQSSVINYEESLIVSNMIETLRKKYSGRIIVVTPYLGQRRVILNEIRQKDFSNVEVNTVDALQGDEEDVVIYCMTRARQRTKFFSDSARLNVAFSRAKNTLIIIGSMKYLYSYDSGHILRKAAEYLQKNARIVSCKKNKGLFI